jgi:hypothetical protein
MKKKDQYYMYMGCASDPKVITICFKFIQIQYRLKNTSIPEDTHHALSSLAFLVSIASTRPFSPNRDNNALFFTHTHTHIYIYIYMYILYGGLTTKNSKY